MSSSMKWLFRKEVSGSQGSSDLEQGKPQAEDHQGVLAMNEKGELISDDHGGEVKRTNIRQLSETTSSSSQPNTPRGSALPYFRDVAGTYKSALEHRPLAQALENSLRKGQISVAVDIMDRQWDGATDVQYGTFGDPGCDDHEEERSVIEASELREAAGIFIIVFTTIMCLAAAIVYGYSPYFLLPSAIP
uniref:Uncharacterized protein n=1 Tax=Lotharella oceanica TaxID=641309 RepID=A0A7S2U496_9EUKA|mmetsp:Transcript_9776/g.18812  ORF Transcript_9776/g.18812 Transcript_9776/m.18812 type:complete len:190 (+) Transcript_9776:78-647(+)